MRWRMKPDETGKAMLRAGLDASTLAAEIGISKPVVWRAVTGRTAPTAATIKAICDRLGADAVELCTPT